MSASELKRRLVAVLDLEIEKYATIALQQQRWPGAVSKIGMPTPPSTAEDIGLIVLEANAFRRGVEAAKNALIDEHQKLVAPDSPPRDAEPLEEATSERKDPIY